VIERGDLHGHGLSFRRGFGRSVALAAAVEVCYNAARSEFNRQGGASYPARREKTS
jgi:hypothetical protein